MILLIDFFGVCMQLHEIILSVLGIILFIAAIIFTALKRDVKLLIAMYLLSIVMIAFPAFTKIVFADVTLEVQQLQCINNKLAQNPQDSSLQRQAMQKIENITQKGLDSTNTTTVTTVANTNALLGDSVKAVDCVNKGLRYNSGNSDLLKLKQQLLTPRIRLEMQINKVTANPADSQAMQQLKSDVHALQATAPSNAHALTTLSKASLLLGDTAKAARQVDSAVHINPKNAEAKKLQERIKFLPIKANKANH